MPPTPLSATSPLHHGRPFQWRLANVRKFFCGNPHFSSLKTFAFASKNVETFTICFDIQSIDFIGKMSYAAAP